MNLRTQLILMTVGMFLTGCTIPTTSLGQEESISANRFWSDHRKAVVNSVKESRRITKSQKVYAGTKLTSSIENVAELLLPDKHKETEVAVYEGKETKTEMIRIGDAYFCRTNNDQWKKETSSCIGARIPPGTQNGPTSRYTRSEEIFEGKNIHVYKHLGSYGTPGSETDLAREFEHKFYVNPEGRLIGTELKLKTPALNSEAVMTEKIDFVQNELKIEAPIK